MRLVVIIMAALVCSAADAYVRIAPAESGLSWTKTYCALVPAEDAVTATSAQLDLPDGVRVVSASVPAGAPYQPKRNGKSSAPAESPGPAPVTRLPPVAR